MSDSALTTIQQPNISHTGIPAHRYWLTKLREDWFSQAILVNTNSDSGIEMNSHRNMPQNRDPSADNMDSESLILSIQHEAENAQRVVDLMTSTETMKKRKNLSGDLTYRRRGAKAKQTLASYSPRTPRAAQWGVLFDRMVARLRGQTLEEADEGSSSSTESRCSFLSSHSSYHWDEPDVDKLALEVRCPSATLYINGSADILPMTSQRNNSSLTNASRPISLATFSNGDFWEENWVTPTNTPDDEITTDTTRDMCNVCRLGQDEADQYPYSINLCYKNHNCLQSSDSKHGTCDSNANTDTSQLSNELRSVVIRRPELSICQLPQPPIRKTESNNQVWMVKSDKRMTPTGKPAKRSIWKRLRKLFRSR